MASVVRALLTRRRLSRTARQVFRSQGSKSQLYKVRHVLNVSSNASGVITGSASTSNPTNAWNGATTYTEWSNLAALFDEYRVRSIQLNWYPFRPASDPTASGATAPIAYQPIAVVYDVDQATLTLASYDQAMQYAGQRMFDIFKPWRVRHRVVYPGAMQSKGWQNVDTPGGVGCVAIYADGITQNIGYGKLMITLTLQFRARR